jgi:hypothetical protein
MRVAIVETIRESASLTGVLTAAGTLRGADDEGDTEVVGT